MNEKYLKKCVCLDFLSSSFLHLKFFFKFKDFEGIKFQPGTKKKLSKEFLNKWGLHSTEVAYFLLTQWPRVRFHAFPKIFMGKIIDVAEVNQRRGLEESGHKIADQIQKRISEQNSCTDFQNLSPSKFSFALY